VLHYQFDDGFTMPDEVQLVGVVAAVVCFSFFFFGAERMLFVMVFMFFGGLYFFFSRLGTVKAVHKNMPY
jgi:hypothetical protein